MAKEEYSVMVREELATAIGKVVGAKLRREPVARVHGGSINACYRWESEAGPIFVKIAPARSSEMFAAEAAGLEELRSADAVRVPRVLGVGADAVDAWLALEWIKSVAPSRSTDTVLGEQLARQHRFTSPAFGWRRDNTIGSTPQPNQWLEDWVTFFGRYRLRYQLDLAADNDFGGRLQERGGALLDRLGELFAGHRPAPSLLHGDLWAGNRCGDEKGQPVIFDPAVYFGDREVDLAMTRLFGGFNAGFYSAYEAVWPVDSGADTRANLYNLYHVLNHLNLFGSGYLRQAVSLIDSLMAELGH